MNKKEAIILLSELGANQLVNLNLVLLEKRERDRYRLQIRGDFVVWKCCNDGLNDGVKLALGIK